MAPSPHGAAVPAVPVHDTVKRWRPARRRVVETLPRETLFLAQTPQAFRRDVLAAAIDAGRGGASGTDEAMLAEQAGHEVRLVAGDDANVKITTADDLDARPPASPASVAAGRIGTGYDLHVFAEGRPLILGGVRIPCDRGLRGHSDADAVCHAVTDAILGAADLGDIGRLFPDTDPALEGRRQPGAARRRRARVRDAGWQVVNVDVVVIAERPKIGPHRGGDAGVAGRPLGVDPGASRSRARPTKASTPPAAARRWRCTRSRSSRGAAVRPGHDRLRRARRAFEALRAGPGDAPVAGPRGRAARRRPNRRTADLVAEAKRAGVPVDTISEEQASRLSSGRPHQGMIAEVQAPEDWTPADLVAAARAPALARRPRRHRGSAQPGRHPAHRRRRRRVDGVVRQARRSAPLDGAVGKTSAGAVAHLKIATVVNVTRALEELKEAGVWTVGLASVRGRRLRPDRSHRPDGDRGRRRGHRTPASGPGGLRLRRRHPYGRPGVEPERLGGDRRRALRGGPAAPPLTAPAEPVLYLEVLVGRTVLPSVPVASTGPDSGRMGLATGIGFAGGWPAC